MNSGEDIEDLIQQLQELHLRQASLLSRLARATSVESHAPPRSNTVPTNETQGFVIGDRVRILNPGVFQTDRGIVIKIGQNRVTVQTRTGSKIVRAHKNLIIDNE